MLIQRILTATVLIAIFATIIALGEHAVLATTLVLMFVMSFEFYTAVLPEYRRLHAAMYALLNCFLPLGYLMVRWPGIVFAMMVIVVIIGVMEVIRTESEIHEEPTGMLFYVFTGVSYVGVLGTAFTVGVSTIYQLFGSSGWQILVWFVGIVVASDTAAFFGGRFFGGPKLAPRISPGKTRSGGLCGFVGALLFGVGFGVTQVWGYSPRAAAVCLLLSLCIAVLAPLGDLLESLIKRSLGIKDMGTLFPGHGGVLDRMDSYLLSAPVLMLLYLFFV